MAIEEFKGADKSPSPRSRAAHSGDTAPARTPKTIEKFASSESAAGALETRANALNDVLVKGSAETHEAEVHDGLIDQVNAILKGTSPDDLEVMRKRLKEHRRLVDPAPPNQDLELVEN